MHEQGRTFHFSVDGKRFNTQQETITGAQIKAIAGVTPTYQLFLEEEGDAPDRAISDGESLNLDEEHGEREFYAVPPATFGT